MKLQIRLNTRELSALCINRSSFTHSPVLISITTAAPGVSDIACDQGTRLQAFSLATATGIATDFFTTLSPNGGNKQPKR